MDEAISKGTYVVDPNDAEEIIATYGVAMLELRPASALRIIVVPGSIDSYVRRNGGLN